MRALPTDVLDVVQVELGEDFFRFSKPSRHSLCCTASSARTWSPLVATDLN